jgi:hypothetical protein
MSVRKMNGNSSNFRSSGARTFQSIQTTTNRVM